jgi:hypothetical protein
MTRRYILRQDLSPSPIHAGGEIQQERRRIPDMKQSAPVALTFLLLALFAAAASACAQRFTLPSNISNNDNISDNIPQVYGDYVVWAERDANDSEIYLYRISDNTLIGNISNNDGKDDGSPQIQGESVVWDGDDGNDREISLTSILLFPWPMFLPAITGR